MSGLFGPSSNLGLAGRGDNGGGAFPPVVTETVALRGGSDGLDGVGGGMSSPPVSIVVDGCGESMVIVG